MGSHAENNKRIAKNTLMLYGRTFITLLVSLYTSRVILNVLGISDYGVFNAVGGVVAMFSVITGSLSTTIGRFITYELGHGDSEKLKRVFSTSVNIQFCISLIILLLGETIGLWFLNSQMDIPEGRMTAAHYVYQCSLFSFAISLISVPYNACIVAHERMSAFAYISILEVLLKLAIVYLLLISPFDKLSAYSVLLVIVALIVRLIYGVYCRRHFEESKYSFVHDKTLTKEMAGFASWGFFGNSAYILNTQGVNILINIFFGVTLNAARGVATQVQAAVMSFVGNFGQAMNPQITKSYASGEMDYMHNLICRGAKYSFFMTLLFVVPIACEADYILELWLKNVPDYAPSFVRMTLFGAMATNLGNTLYTGIMATGTIRKYQFWITLIGCLVFPLTWITYKIGCPAVTTYAIYIAIYYLLIYIRLYFGKRLLNTPVRTYLKEVVLRTHIVAVVTFIPPLFIVHFLEPGFIRLCVTTIVALLSTAIGIYTTGFDKGERQKMVSRIIGAMSKKFSSRSLN